jgi:hypothetical protein
MRYRLFSLLVLVSCGASEVQSQRLKDGSYQFTCELSMDECIRRVQSQCKHERFRIIEGSSETRLRDAPPFERAYHTSRVHLVCTDAGADVLTGVKDDTTSQPQASSCSKGETRACVGPGACQGGQACLPDRSGFGSCDCGPAQTEAAAPAATTSSPATESSPGPSGTTGAAGSGALPAPAAPAKP